MSIFVHLSDRSGLPRYRQIERQVRAAIGSGALRTGDRLPTIRDFAVRLRVNPATVIQAYDVLEAAGVIERRHGSGTFVGDPVPETGIRARRERAAEAIDHAIVEARGLGLGDGEITGILRERLAARGGPKLLPQEKRKRGAA